MLTLWPGGVAWSQVRGVPLLSLYPVSDIFIPQTRDAACSEEGGGRSVLAVFLQKLITVPGRVLTRDCQPLAITSEHCRGQKHLLKIRDTGEEFHPVVPASSVSTS